mgnify:FL=1
MLNQRIMSASVMLSVFLATFFFLDPIFFEFLVFIVGGFLLFELSKILKLEGANLIFFWVISLAPVATDFIRSLIYYSTLFSHPFFQSYLPLLTDIRNLFFWVIPVSLIFWLIIVPADLFTKKISSSYPTNIFYGLFLVTPLLITIIFIFRENRDLLLTIILMIWIADIGAYFTGKKFGSIKLVKNISPGKTLEGLIGGFLFNTLFVIFLYLLESIDLVEGLMLGVFVTTLSFYGDIYESFLKRKAGVKDSSSMIPGHGGFLDRLDSFCPTIPLLYIFFEASEFF